jgi:hypothetical protein
MNALNPNIAPPPGTHWRVEDFSNGIVLGYAKTGGEAIALIGGPEAVIWCEEDQDHPDHFDVFALVDKLGRVITLTPVSSEKRIALHRKGRASS